MRKYLKDKKLLAFACLRLEQKCELRYERLSEFEGFWASCGKFDIFWPVKYTNSTIQQYIL